MPRGSGSIAFVHYRGQKKSDGSKGDDYIVYIDDLEDYQKWKDGDTSIPLTNFAGTDVYTSHKQGKQTADDRVSDFALANDFPDQARGGKPDMDAIIRHILSSSEATLTHIEGRQGPTNDSMDSMRTK
jgi:hypothetical protein